MFTSCLELKTRYWEPPQYHVLVSRFELLNCRIFRSAISSTYADSTVTHYRISLISAAKTPPKNADVGCVLCSPETPVLCSTRPCTRSVLSDTRTQVHSSIDDKDHGTSSSLPGLDGPSYLSRGINASQRSDDRAQTRSSR